jgi:hypothetical protein
VTYEVNIMMISSSGNNIAAQQLLLRVRSDVRQKKSASYLLTRRCAIEMCV